MGTVCVGVCRRNVADARVVQGKTWCTQPIPRDPLTIHSVQGWR